MKVRTFSNFFCAKIVSLKNTQRRCPGALEKDGEVRLSTNEEALEYLQYSEQGDGEK